MYPYIDAPHIPKAPRSPRNISPKPNHHQNLHPLILREKASQALGFLKGSGVEFLGHPVSLMELGFPAGDLGPVSGGALVKVREKKP